MPEELKEKWLFIRPMSKERKEHLRKFAEALLGLCDDSEGGGAIVFQQKSKWQKDDCIATNSAFGCGNRSTLEAIAISSGSSLHPMIRCCTSPMCKAFARDLALQMLAVQSEN